MVRKIKVMNDLTISIKKILGTISEYNAKGKYKVAFRIFLILFSALMLYTAGKIFGEVIYHITH